MKSIKKYLSLLFVLSFYNCAQTFPDYTTRLSMRSPTVLNNGENAEAIGEYSLGCLKGAQTFQGSEVGIILSQKKRGRYWGHPDLIKLLTDAGQRFHQLKRNLILGDLSQSRGGPMISGHNSHQTGLDVDVWFYMPSIDQNISFRDLELNEMHAIEKLQKDQIELVKYFVSVKNVERIFINPNFKKQLCSDSDFLKLPIEEQQKLRAWWGHDDHIHIRLKCPSDSKKCVSQAPIPSGNGCGEELNWWFTKEAKDADVDLTANDLKNLYLDKVKKLPKDCFFYKAEN